MKPPLKWAGGKRLLAPQIESLWLQKTYERLVEPFAGGLAVSFHIQPQQVLANDINPHLMNFYRYLQQGLKITTHFENTEECYYGARKTFNSLITDGGCDSKFAAHLFYFLNRQGFNGLCRFNKRGEMNTPYGKYKKLNITADLTEYAEVMANWELQCTDFSNLVIKPTDFVYCDPPYIATEFTTYSKEGFSDQDHERLLEWATSLPCTVVISNKYTPHIKKLYQEYGFKVEMLEARRSISCNGDRTPAVEILAIK